MRKILSLILVVILVFPLSSCENKKDTIYDYIGDEGYTFSISCMVLEEIEGEYDESGNIAKGLIYRKVNDLNGLLDNSALPVIIYFYSSQYPNSFGAGVEDLAESLWGQAIFVSVDLFSEIELTDVYEVDTVPSFVYYMNGTRSSFLPLTSDTIYIEEVVIWVQELGLTPSFS